MPKNAVTITDQRTDKTYESPVEHGTVRAMDLRKIKTDPDDFGLMTYDPAFMNTASCKSSITFIDGDKGILRYRGYDIETLAEHCNYLQVAYLLLYGELPNPQQDKDWIWEITHHTMLHETTKHFIDGFRYDAHPMGILVSTLAALSTVYPEAKNVHDPENRQKQIVRLIAKMATLAAYSYRHRRGHPYIYPDNDLSYTENFMNMLWRMTEPKYVASPVIARALDVLFILHADHEQNCSSTTMRVVGSAQADPYLSMAGAATALSGPLHGGANEEVLRMLDEIGSVKNIPAYIKRVKAGEIKLMGFGHRVYKNYDPRAQHHQGGRQRGLRGHRPQQPARHCAGARTHSSGRRLLRHSQAVSQRRLLLRHHLPVHGLPARHVHRAVRDSARGRLAGAVERNDPGPGAEDRASAPDLHRCAASQATTGAG